MGMESAGYIQFIVKEVPDTSPQLLDNVLRILLQLLTTWRNGVTGTTAISQQHHRLPQDDPPNVVSVCHGHLILSNPSFVSSSVFVFVLSRNSRRLMP